MPQQQESMCQNCLNCQNNLRMQNSNSNASVSSPVDNFYPSGGSSSYDRNSLIGANRSPG